MLKPVPIAYADLFYKLCNAIYYLTECEGHSEAWIQSFFELSDEELRSITNSNTYREIEE